MTVVSGELFARLATAAPSGGLSAGTVFEVPGKSGFDVRAGARRLRLRISVSPEVVLAFAGGTLELRGLAVAAGRAARLPWDARTACHRAPRSRTPTSSARPAPASRRRSARAYVELPTARSSAAAAPVPVRSARGVARERGRGVVVLPTGAGKTQVACMAIDDKRRATLVVAPTLDLVRQWYDLLQARPSAQRVGRHRLVGAANTRSSRSPSRPTTPPTCTWSTWARASVSWCSTSVTTCPAPPTPGRAPRLAPFRLGLTATPERADGRDVRARRADRAGRLPQGHRRSGRRLPGRVRDRARRRRAGAGRARRIRGRARHLSRLRVRATGSAWRARKAGRSSSCARPAASPAAARCRPIAGSASSRSARRPSSITSSTCSNRHRADRAHLVHAGQRHLRTRSRGAF